MKAEKLFQDLTQKQYNFIMSARRAHLLGTHNFDPMKFYRNVGHTMSYKKFQQAIEFIQK